MIPLSPSVHQNSQKLRHAQVKSIDRIIFHSSFEGEIEKCVCVTGKVGGGGERVGKVDEGGTPGGGMPGGRKPGRGGPPGNPPGGGKCGRGGKAPGGGPVILSMHVLYLEETQERTVHC